MLINVVSNICFFEITNFKTNLFISFHFTSYHESLILFFLNLFCYDCLFWFLVLRGHETPSEGSHIG